MLVLREGGLDRQREEETSAGAVRVEDARDKSKARANIEKREARRKRRKTNQKKMQAEYNLCYK